MSKLVPNVVNTARIFRNQDFVGKFSHNHTSICLSTPYLCFELSKQEPKGRFFADKAMIQFAGGPWFIENFKKFLEPQLSRLRDLHLLVRLSEIEALDLFSYRTCNVELVFNHPTRPNPIALQLVQKAQLFSIVDAVLEREIASIA